jgi:hypothetical protein
MIRMPKTIWLCAGLAGGVFLTLGIQHALREPEQAARAAPSREPAVVAELRRDNEDLRATVAIEKARADQFQKDLEAAKRDQAVGLRPAKDTPPAPDAPSDTPPTDDELMKGVETFGASLGEIMQGRGEEARKELRDLLARAGEHGIELLVAKFGDDATDIGLRVAIAHALAQSGDPGAIEWLKTTVSDPEAGMLELRLASHGLAFSDAEGIDNALLAVAHKTADTGARANAAFGLARRKNPEGLALYLKATDEALANRDPAALQYLGGFTLLGDDALPALRERLLTYTEPQAAITLIEILKGRGDRGAVETLRKLASDEGRPASVRKAAEGAIKALEQGSK